MSRTILVTKPIETVRIGDKVWAWDENSGMRVKARVTRLFRRSRMPVLELVCASDATEREQCIVATTEHPFWIAGKGWMPAHALRAGDVLRRITSGPHLSVLRVVSQGLRADAFNFEVEGAHNYFVGQAGILVHNESYLGTATDADFMPTGSTIGPRAEIGEPTMAHPDDPIAHATDGRRWFHIFSSGERSRHAASTAGSGTVEPALPQLSSPDEGFIRVYRGNNFDGPQVSKRYREGGAAAAPSGADHFLDLNEGIQHAKAGAGGTLDGLSVSTDVSRAVKFGQFLIVYDIPHDVFERLPIGDPSLAEKVFKHSIPEHYRVATLRAEQALILKDRQSYAFPFHKFDVPFFVRMNYMP